MNKKYLCLPGGSDYCRWQAGFCYYLGEIGELQTYTAIFGTSGGGLNALSIAKYIDDLPKFKAMWNKVQKDKDMYDGSTQVNNVWDAVCVATQFLVANKGKSILKPVGLDKLLKEEFGGRNTKDFKIPTLVTATNMTTGKTEVFTEGDAEFIARATSRIPGAFDGIEYNGMIYSDGGLLKNNPVSFAIEAGATEITLIGTTPDEFAPDKNLKNLAIALALRSVGIMLHENEEQSWDAKDRHPEVKYNVYYPKTIYGDGLHVDPKRWIDGYDYAKANWKKI